MDYRKLAQNTTASVRPVLTASTINLRLAAVPRLPFWVSIGTPIGAVNRPCSPDVGESFGRRV